MVTEVKAYKASNSSVLFATEEEAGRCEFAGEIISGFNKKYEFSPNKDLLLNYVLDNYYLIRKDT